jgi:hypothetical protein
MDSERYAFVFAVLLATGLGATVGLVYQLLMTLRDAFNVEPAPINTKLRWIGRSLQLLSLAGGFAWVILVFRLLPQDDDLAFLVAGFIVYLIATRRHRARIAQEFRRMIASKDRDWTRRAV